MPYVDTLRYPLAERLRSGEPLAEALDLRQDLAGTDQSGQTRSPDAERVTGLPVQSVGRSERIRTSDPIVPNKARRQNAR
jgi:hypothetical protein